MNRLYQHSKFSPFKFLPSIFKIVKNPLWLSILTKSKDGGLL